MKIVKIDSKYRDSLIEALDRNDTSKKTRPYYLNLKIKDFSILIPLRSNCPNSPYSISIYNPDHKKANHGLDCSKMIIVEKEKLNSVTSSTFINNKIRLDIETKKEIIKVTAIKTINDYLKMKRKIEKGLDLNDDEYFLYIRSTLVNFDNELNDIVSQHEQTF